MLSPPDRPRRVPRPCPRPAAGSHDERGSLIVVILVIFVLASLGTALVTQVVTSDKTAFGAQNRGAAIAAAEAGISDALFRIDQETTSWPSFCVLGSGKSTITPTTCPLPVATSVPGATDVSYTATYANGSYLIRSEAWVNGTEAAVEATDAHTEEYPFAMFGLTQLKFNGTNNFEYYNDTLPASATNPDPSGTGGTTVSIGSSGQVDCTGGVGTVNTILYSSGASQTDCPNVATATSTYGAPSTSPPPNASPCPGTGTGGGTIGAASTTTTLAGGTYYCDVPVTMSGNIVLAGTVKLYIDPPAGTTTDALTIAGGSTVNIPSSPLLPEASLLQIFSPSTAGIGNYNGAGTYSFGGTIDAPSASLTGDGCKSTYYGALILNTYTCNGAHLTVAYDTSLSSVYSAWKISGYREIPASLIH